MPQVARTARWPRFLSSLVFQAYLFLLVNVIVQSTLLYMIAKEELVMDLFAGQMYLCDFGAWLSRCPGHPSCTGPAGSQITPPRMYSYAMWSTRTYARDSLKALFPDRVDEIHAKIDPGEYGVESYWCRWLCCFIFMMSVMSELFLNVEMLKLVWFVPSRNEPWIELVEE